MRLGLKKEFENGKITKKQLRNWAEKWEKSCDNFLEGHGGGKPIYYEIKGKKHLFKTIKEELREVKE